jgi:hypothetical protein
MDRGYFFINELYNNSVMTTMHILVLVGSIIALIVSLILLAWVLESDDPRKSSSGSEKLLLRYTELKWFNESSKKALEKGNIEEWERLHEEHGKFMNEHFPPTKTNQSAGLHDKRNHYRG